MFLLGDSWAHMLLFFVLKILEWHIRMQLGRKSFGGYGGIFFDWRHLTANFQSDVIFCPAEQ